MSPPRPDAACRESLDLASVRAERIPYLSKNDACLRQVAASAGEAAVREGEWRCFGVRVIALLAALGQASEARGPASSLEPSQSQMRPSERLKLYLALAVSGEVLLQEIRRLAPAFTAAGNRSSGNTCDSQTEAPHIHGYYEHARTCKRTLADTSSSACGPSP